MRENYRIIKATWVALLLTIPIFASSQHNVTGKIIDETGASLPSVMIQVKGTTRGTTTTLDGEYEISVKDPNATLVFSYIGYKKQRIPLNGRNILNVTLSEDVEKLSEVVVTALGVEREEKAIGYSVQSIGADEIATVKSTNPINSLAGKVSGVYITGSSNGPTASANINIRGAASLLGNNQPLFVVNGMPITNDLYSLDDGLNGSTTIDFGNASQIVNPDDIQSINILKGPAASALYGSRAADGVILIETKTGENAQGIGVEINSSTMFESILKLPDYQNEYGFGGNGMYSYYDGTVFDGVDFNGNGTLEPGGGELFYEAYGENWGPRMNGQLIKQSNSNGEAVPFTPAEDNVRNFFRTGVTSINNISINSSNEDGDYRLSYTNLANRGIVPNTNLKRNTVQASFGKRFFDDDKLRTRANIMYVASASDNVPNAGYDESSSVMYGWLWYPRQVNINDLKDYWEVPGEQQRYVEDSWVNNPWLIAKENTNSFQSKRFIGNFKVNYDFAKNFTARFRFGADVLNEGRQYRRAPSTKGVLRGSYREDEISFSETNAELLVGYHTDMDDMSFFDLDVKVGGNIMRQDANYLIANNPELENFGTDPSIYTLTNARSGVLVESQKTQMGINSLFATATFSMLNSIFIDASYRNDWNSTLVNPYIGRDNSSYSFGYPSVAVSGVISDLVQLPSAFSFLKVKGSYAEVGNGAPAYAFGNTFTPQAAYGSQAIFSTNRTIADEDLTNERTKAYETGLDVRLFEGRIRLDFTYYDMLSYDQVINLPVATTSGYDYALTNGGEIRNRGIELMLGGRAVETENFSWDITFNAGRNRAVVESLPDVIESGRYSIVADMFPGDGSSADLEYVAEEGELLGQLYGLGFERGPDGRVIHQDGLPVLTDEKVSAGSYQPDWRIGLNNSFKYKNITVGILFDGQIGGKVYSRSHALYATGGAITNDDDPHLDLSTTEGRRVYSVDYNADGLPVYTLEQEGGVVGPGWNWTDANGDGVFRNEDGSFQTEELSENDVVVQPGGAGYTGYFYNYYGNGFNRDNIEAATYDATYFKLRELSIKFDLPHSLAEKIGMQKASIAFIGKNLLLFTDVPTIDPETYSIRNGIFVNGYESTQFPSTRSYGFSINLGF
ncbi:SusC/RagA family TonB-linked outer membrane protein [Fulvivirga maritima]|uniref:SusC/RagA family TonB-linked outer membrane protein n=1 Tax=Fulvivirga maritima TaxID=2904247 RepID=UPI001F45B140|nr:SusC/RagA family TonB-linked outer membrane protein [Fulvivirga maritima]UII24482.1 SusC/RagA family TonB-linked outer membrane protein [Fulvivirga maritima]